MNNSIRANGDSNAVIRTVLKEYSTAERLQEYETPRKEMRLSEKY
jgi:hypothetical protein